MGFLIKIGGGGCLRRNVLLEFVSFRRRSPLRGEEPHGSAKTRSLFLY